MPETREVNVTFLLCPHQSIPRVAHSILDTFKEHQQTEEDPLETDPDGSGPGCHGR